jgi:hypothetical protein
MKNKTTKTVQQMSKAVSLYGKENLISIVFDTSLILMFVGTAIAFVAPTAVLLALASLIVVPSFISLVVTHTPMVLEKAANEKRQKRQKRKREVRIARYQERNLIDSLIAIRLLPPQSINDSYNERFLREALTAKGLLPSQNGNAIYNNEILLEKP